MLTPAPLQTTYPQYMVFGQVGQIITTTGWDVDTKLCEDLSGLGIGFGLAVTQGSLHGDRSACLGAFSGGRFVGITCADPTLINLPAGFTDKFQDGENMAVLVRGDICVTAVQQVTAGGLVFFNATTGVLGTSGTTIEESRWMTSTTGANQLAICRLSKASGNTGN